MKFEFTLEQNVAHSGEHEISEIDTQKKLFIARDEILSEYEKDDTSFYMTLRELIFMYHNMSGYLTQLTDYAMSEMYDEVKAAPEIKGISFYLNEREKVETHFKDTRSHSTTIKFVFER